MKLFKTSLNIIFTGPKGSGKTTLLYSSYTSNFVNIPAFEPTKSLNFERINYNNQKLYIWDVSGHEAISSMLLPILYSSINVRAIVYVVNLLENNRDVLDIVSNELRGLLYSQQLSTSLFCVIFNTFGSESDSWPYSGADLAALLELCHLPPEIDIRTKWYVVNTAQGIADPGWKMALDFIITARAPPPTYYSNIPDAELTPIHLYFSQFQQGQILHPSRYEQIIPPYNKVDQTQSVQSQYYQQDAIGNNLRNIDQSKHKSHISKLINKFKRK
ncbi:hypothetical protein cand_034820 [Cryptosporidium andersoni]|uniref:ADP-ribosylation factor n=1 Tax=Cryptosporidium andersoni TaxID=117008 RepID=A0A1J4MVG4_9CRYT|nr:hypothetical protein cand_034820 [Cryptosporidium andersoni]